MDDQVKLCITAFAIYLLNIPFGYWRRNVKKTGLQWYLAIHIPVLMIIIFRIWSDIGFHWITYAYFVCGFFFGQLTGGMVFKWRLVHHKKYISSCMVMDLARRKR